MTPRSKGPCELCGASSPLTALPIDSGSEGDADKSAFLCGDCHAPILSGAPLTGGHWFCLQASIWSEVPAVQVLSYRLLHRLEDKTFATDLLDQVYLDEDTLAWAQRGLEASDEPEIKTIDSNGVALSNGDSVTLIKDLNVKGAGFTAKRGTVVKNIYLGGDPTHVEGKINRVSIMLKTCFLKRVS